MTLHPRPASPDEPTNVETDHPRAPASAGVFTRPLFSCCCCPQPTVQRRRSLTHFPGKPVVSKVCPIRFPATCESPAQGPGAWDAVNHGPGPPHRSGILEEQQ